MKLSFEKSFLIGKSGVGEGFAPLLIAETACAHHGSVEEAKKLVEAASDAGADLVQLQIFRSAEQVGGNHPIYNLLCDLELSDRDWSEVFAHAKKTKTDTMVFVYDLPSLELALDFDPQALKLNSSDLMNAPLLRACAETGLPIFLGTGASRIEEITEAVSWIQECGGSKLILMHGIQDFPTHLRDSRLQRIQLLKSLFDLPVGYGDHTDADLSIAPYVDFLALGLGVDCLEKHITIDRKEKKTDYQAALNPEQWKDYAENISSAWLALEDQLPIDLTEADLRYRKFQKKYAVMSKPVMAGEAFGIESVKFLRVEEGEGISAMAFQSGQSYRSGRDLREGDFVLKTDLQS